MIEDFKKRMKRAVRGMGWGEAGELMGHAAILSVALLVLAAALLKEEWLIVGGALSLLPVVAAYAFPVYFWASRQRRMEAELPQALYHAASGQFVPLEDIVEELARGKGALAGEFKKAAMQLRNGIPVTHALEDMVKSNDSQLLKRAIGLLLQSYRTGADMGQAFRETAEEISAIAEATREQSASTTIEKYTLLLAGGAIVPLVLGTLIAMVGSLDFAGLAELGFGLGSSGAVLASALLGSQVYIVEYALLAAVFVAYQEGSIEKAVVYAAILVPLSVALFTVARSGIFV